MGIFPLVHVSCTVHSAQVRLVMPTYWALDITDPFAIKMQHAKEQQLNSKSVNCGSAERYMGTAGPGGGGNAQPGPKDICARHRIESADAWCPSFWGAGPTSYYLCPSSYCPKATGSKPQGQEEGSHSLIQGF